MSVGRPDDRSPDAGAPHAETPVDGPVRQERLDAAGGYLNRQRALLDDMLRVTLEQRRCLVKGDVKGLDAANRRLGALLQRQAGLHGQYPPLEGIPAPEALEELRRLTQQLREESRTNYLLACRGAQFAHFSLSLLQSAVSEGEPASDSAASTSIRLVDART